MKNTEFKEALDLIDALMEQVETLQGLVKVTLAVAERWEKEAGIKDEQLMLYRCWFEGSR
jgi:hypothetical protein